MVYINLKLFVFLTLVLVIESATYIGAVAEHETYLDSTETLKSNLEKNLNYYNLLIQISKKNLANIIVFPEFGITPCIDNDRICLSNVAEKIPTPNNIIPCNNEMFISMPILNQVSCMAKENNIEVLINLIDFVDCDITVDSSCPSDNHYLYNTDVVFDNNGELKAKYHKSHEWPKLMPAYNQPKTPDYVTYTSTFGVTFGIFTCFDILHENPPNEYIKNGINHILYPVQQGLLGEDSIISGWSKIHNATILSSNLGSSIVHDCSGIITNGKALPFKKFYVNDSSKENVKISTVQY
jgi:predicted amidohydrolase